MTLLCPPPDANAGVAVRMSDFMACEARALGENGFQAFAGGPVGVSLLSGLLTLFIGFIGYRLILGETPSVRDGVSWMVRVGFVLALVTSWPAFQTLAFRVAVDGPGEVAGIILPASGLPADDLSSRVQRAYDTLRLGSSFQATNSQQEQGQSPQASNVAMSQAALYQTALPQTASLFVLSTSGVLGAFHIAIGFLLAIAPLPLMALLFDGTMGIFIGWIRALAGSALASLGAIVVTAAHLLAVESELAHLQSMRLGGAERMLDPQALTTIVFIFSLAILVTSFAAMRVASAFQLKGFSNQTVLGVDRLMEQRSTGTEVLRSAENSVSVRRQLNDQSRAAGVADALALTIRREEASAARGGTNLLSVRNGLHGERSASDGTKPGLGTSVRRTVSRRTRSAVRRDRAGG